VNKDLAQRLKDLNLNPVWEALLEWVGEQEELCLLRVSPYDPIEVNAQLAAKVAGKLEVLWRFENLPSEARQIAEG